MMEARALLIPVLPLVLAAAVGAGSAEAQPPSARAAAEARLLEGKKLLAAGKVPEACAKLEASYKLDQAPSTQITLATCHEAEGKTGTAFKEFTEALTAARKEKRPDREKIAKDRIAALEPRLARFVVSVSTEAALPGLEVKVSGVVISKEAWGTPIPVDPGEQTAAATAPHREPWEARLMLRERESTTVVIPVLKQPPRPPRPPPPKAPAWERPVGIAALGVGALGLALGTYFGVRAISLGAESNLGCSQGVCNAEGYQAYKDGRAAATASNILFAAGIAVAGAGAVLLIHAALTESAQRPAQREAAALRIQASPLPSWGGLVTVGGAF
jgi:hypothetical protein